jgi:hypothetical protein
MKRSKKYQRNRKSRRQKTRQKKFRTKRYRTKSKTSRRRRTRKTKLKRGGGDEGRTTAIAFPPPEVERAAEPMKPVTVPEVGPAGATAKPIAQAQAPQPGKAEEEGYHNLGSVIMRSNTPRISRRQMYPSVDAVMWVWEDLSRRLESANEEVRNRTWINLVSGQAPTLRTPRKLPTQKVGAAHTTRFDLVTKTAESKIQYFFGGQDPKEEKLRTKIYLTLKEQKKEHHEKEFENLQALRTSFSGNKECLPFLLAAEGHVIGHRGYMLSPFIGGYPIDLSATTTLLANMSMNEYTHPIVVEIIKCVACLHKYDLFHKDIKPANFVYGLNDAGKLFLKVIDTYDVQDLGNKPEREAGAPSQFISAAAKDRDDLYHHMTPWYISPYEFVNASVHQGVKDAENALAEAMESGDKKVITDMQRKKDEVVEAAAKAERESIKPRLKMVDYWGVLMTIFDLFMCSIMDLRKFPMINQYEFAQEDLDPVHCMVTGFESWAAPDVPQSRLFPIELPCRLYASFKPTGDEIILNRLGGNLCMSKYEAAAAAALRAELSGSSIETLKERAQLLGVDQDAINKLADAPDIKAAAVELVFAVAPLPMTPPEEYNEWIITKVAGVNGDIPELFPQEELGWPRLVEIAMAGQSALIAPPEAELATGEEDDDAAVPAPPVPAPPVPAPLPEPAITATGEENIGDAGVVINTDLSPYQFMNLVFREYPGKGLLLMEAVEEFNRVFETLFNIK